MAANLIVDLFPVVEHKVSIGPSAGVGSTPASGLIMGEAVDMGNAHVATQLFATGGGPQLSGQFRVQIQTSQDNVSGNFTDPTSGLSRFPDKVLSGGVVVFNSGATGIPDGASGGHFASGVGGIDGCSFLRPQGHKWARAFVVSGDLYNGPVTVGFIGHKFIAGSGDGHSYSPGSGTISV